MVTRPVLLFLGVACGLVFLLVSIHNSRTLNQDLMAKLVETEVESIFLNKFFVSLVLDGLMAQHKIGSKYVQQNLNCQLFANYSNCQHAAERRGL